MGGLYHNERVCAAVSKRAVVLLICVFLVLGASISGTVAYLSGEDEVVNVMTAGRVEIAQQEQQRDSSGELEPFVQNPSFLPAVYEGDTIPLDSSSANWPNADPAWQTFAENTAVVDKFVTVTNEGNVPAYVRTIVALESPGASAGGAAKWVHINDNSQHEAMQSVAKVEEDVTVDGTLYDVYVYTYQDPLAPNNTTIPSLKQLYMNKTCTVEDIQQIGSSYEVLVLSQGVQTASFNDAADALNQSFGEPTADRLAQWLTAAVSGGNGSDNNNPGGDSTGDDPATETVTVTSTEELNAALAKVPDGGSITIQLADSETPYTAPQNATGKTITLKGTSGATLQMITNPNPSGPSDASFADSQLRLEGITVVGAKSSTDQGFACASLDMVDCTIQYNMYLFAPATFTKCSFTETYGNTYHIETNGQNATFTNCDFTTNGKAVHVSSPAASHSTIQASGCTFTDKTGNGVKQPVFVVADDDLSATYSLIITDCTAVGFETDSSTNSNLWNNKNDIEKDRLSVTIDDTSVY